MVIFTFILRSHFKQIEFTFLAVQDSSIGDLVTHLLTHALTESSFDTMTTMTTMTSMTTITTKTAI